MMISVWKYDEEEGVRFDKVQEEDEEYEKGGKEEEEEEEEEEMRY